METLMREANAMNFDKKRELTIEEHDALQKKYPDMTVEYYGGEIVMSSHSSRIHNEIVGNILLILKPFFKGTKCKVYNEQIEVILGYDTNDKQFVFPDVFVACDRKMRGESCIEPPQVIFEVVSEKYRDNDYVKKLALYKKYGVLEYIIVDPLNNTLMCYYMGDESFEVTFMKDYSSKLYDGLVLSIEDIFEG